jgi:hypothetical protein
VAMSSYVDVLPQPPTHAWQINSQGLVSRSVPFSERHDEETQALPGVHCIFFVSPSCLYMYEHTALTKPHQGSLP